MAVYTEVSPEQAQTLLQALNLGPLQAMQGVLGGIENTNYFVQAGSPDAPREYVLTLFERLSAEQLPFYLHLMQHLAQRGLPVPEPVADAHGGLVLRLNGKPAALVNRLSGSSVARPTPSQCAALGTTLAQLHLAGRDYAYEQSNLRGLDWWNQTAPTLVPYLAPEQTRLLDSELAYQNHIAASAAYAALPRGAVHADLFRDNALFVGDQLSGVFDFYFAATDTWLFDLAVCLNDWCVHEHSAAPLAEHFACLLSAYNAVRPLLGAERQLLGALLRAAALRFWISRLWDFYLPRGAALLQAKDPSHLERVLQLRSHHPVTLAL